MTVMLGWVGLYFRWMVVASGVPGVGSGCLGIVCHDILLKANTKGVFDSWEYIRVLG